MILRLGWLVLLAACSAPRTTATDPVPPPGPAPPADADLQRVIDRICSGTCSGPIASVELWADDQGQVRLFIYDGDFNRCSHPPRMHYDRQGNQILAIATNPGATISDDVQAKRRQQTAGLRKTSEQSCRTKPAG